MKPKKWPQPGTRVVLQSAGLDVCNCFALWGKQKYNLVARHVQSDIPLWDKAARGHKVLFASTELDLFIIRHEIASLWKF